MKHNKTLTITLLLACFAAAGCNAQSTSSTQEKPAMTQNTITELQKIDTQIGTGREAEPGFNVTVHYTGWLYDPAAEGQKRQKI